MRVHEQTTAQLGELVVIAFDEAARFSKDPLEVSRLATQAITNMLRRARWPLMSPSPSSASALATPRSQWA
jgi:hypothetical protein